MYINDSTGEQLWTYETGEQIIETHGVGVPLVSLGGNLYALKDDGTLKVCSSFFLENSIVFFLDSFYYSL